MLLHGSGVKSSERNCGEGERLRLVKVVVFRESIFIAPPKPVTFLLLLFGYTAITICVKVGDLSFLAHPKTLSA